ncbi:MAG: HNH nuclease family protein [Proteobacteria bacterium]|nr:HNH nuclease family protein [Pseudomonadota bacterium]
MRKGGYRVYRKKPPKRASSGRPGEDLIKKLRKISSPADSYRDRSIKIHGLICAKCAREFDIKDRHLLTVHHKDGNPRNNPPDGSNWENLCVYCHDDEHSRGRLGDYLSDHE